MRALQSAPPPAVAEPDAQAVAVIGVAAQLPGGASIGEFWDRLLAGENLISPLPHRRRELCTALVGPEAEVDYLTGAWLDAIDEVAYLLGGRQLGGAYPWHEHRGLRRGGRR